MSGASCSAVCTARIDTGGEIAADPCGVRLFPWWSITKTVLAAAALKLVEYGRLALDDRLSDRPFTLRQLLQHRAGVPNYGGLPAYHEAVAGGDEPWPVDELLERVDADRLLFQPSEGWAYSNVGFLFVCRIIEEATSTDAASVMEDLVLTPLGLTSCRLAKLPSDLEGTAFGNAAGYHPGWVYHGLLVGSAIDAVRFLDGLVSGRLLPPDLLTTMTEAHPLGGALPGRPWRSTGYGLGLMIGRMGGSGMAIGHSGAGPGSVSAAYHFPDADPPCTIVAFAAGDDEGVVEHAVDRAAGEGRRAK